MMLTLGSVYSYSVFRLPIEAYYGVSVSQSGIPYMLSLFFYAVFMGVSGRLLERIKPYKIMLTGIFFVTSGWVISYFARSFMLLSIGYGVFIGTGIGLIYGIPLMVITKRFPKRKGLYVGLVLLGFGLSPLITAPLIRVMVDNIGLHTAFLTMGIITMTILMIISYFYRHSDTKQQTEAVVKMSSTIRDHRYQLLYLLFFIGTLIGLSVIGFSANYANDVLSFTLKEAAFLLSIFAIFNGLGRVLYGYFADKISLIKLMLCSYSSLVVSTGSILLIGDSPLVFAIAFSIIWLNLGGWLAIAPLATSQLFGAEGYARNYGFLFSAYGFSAIIGVLISGVLVDSSGSYQSSFLLFLCLSIIGMLMAYLLKSVIDKPQH